MMELWCSASVLYYSVFILYPSSASLSPSPYPFPCISYLGSDIFQTVNWVLPSDSITTTIQHTNTQVTYTMHTSHIHKHIQRTK
jgi:hypothetical protein